MPQATDIVLDGAGYMIASGGSGSGSTSSYTRTQDGMAEGRTARIQMRDFFGGQHRAFQLERDRGGDSLAIGPAYGGQGVVPWPFTTTASLASGAEPPATDTIIPAVTIGNHVFFARGRYLYRSVGLDAISWGAETQVWDAGAGKAISDLANYNGDILIALGAGQDLQILPYPGSGSPVTLLSGEKGRHVVGYGGFAIYPKATIAGATNQIRMVTGSGVDVRYLDADVLKLTTAGGKAFAATKAALYSFSGKIQETTVSVVVRAGPPPITEQRKVLLWSGDWDAYFQHGNWTEDDDYRVVVGYGAGCTSGSTRRCWNTIPLANAPVGAIPDWAGKAASAAAWRAATWWSRSKRRTNGPNCGRGMGLDGGESRRVQFPRAAGAGRWRSPVPETGIFSSSLKAAPRSICFA